MDTQTEVSGFVSQRLFNRANKARRINELEKVEEQGYSDPVAREMILLGRAASTQAENLVEQQFISLGYETKNHGDTSASGADLQVKINGLWRKVEVKSARAHATNGNYNFQGICGSKFDILVLVWITKKGVFMRMAKSSWIEMWMDDNLNSWAVSGRGYTLSMPAHGGYHKKMRGQEILMEINERNMKKMT